MVPPFLKRTVFTPPTGLASLTSTVAAVTVFSSSLEPPPATAITIATTATRAARPSSTVRCLRDMRCSVRSRLVAWSVWSADRRRARRGGKGGRPASGHAHTLRLARARPPLVWIAQMEGQVLTAMEGDVRYARSGEATIAYRVLGGEAPIDIVFIGGLLNHVEVMLEEPGLARFFERLTSFARVILFDRRGSGLSDPLPDGFTLEEEAEDVTAVLDAVGVDRAVLQGYMGGAQLVVQFASLHPERCRALVFYAPILRTLAAPDYEWASDPEERQSRFNQSLEAWGTGSNLHVVAESLADDARVRTWLGRLERVSLSPGALRRMVVYQGELDVRDLLAEINVPSLVVHRTDDPLIDVRHS